MRIPEYLLDRYAYHFTHRDNLPTILKYGLMATNQKHRINLSHQAIAAPNIQERRSMMEVPCRPGGVVHDYVPFYFCPRSPMLYAVLKKGWAEQCDIVYIAVSINIIERTTCVFTDASANTIPPPHFYNNPADLVKIDWGTVDTWNWSSHYDVPGRTPVRQVKQAELLVHKEVAPELFTQIIVWSEEQAKDIRHLYGSLGIIPPIITVGSDDCYFSNHNRTSAIPRIPNSPAQNDRRGQSHESTTDTSDFDSLIQTYGSQILSDAQRQQNADDQYYW